MRPVPAWWPLYFEGAAYDERDRRAELADALLAFFTADDAGHALVTVDLDDPLEALLRPAAPRSSTTPPIIASAGPALWNTMSASMFALSTVNSRKTCMSIVPSSTITAPTTMSSVPAPLDARQMAFDRLSMTAATKATRYSPLRISQAKVEPVLVTTPVWASSG